MDHCPCGSGISYTECCGPLLSGERTAETAERLMRSRYTAYARGDIKYLHDTLHPDQRGDFDENGTKTWAEKSVWHSFEVVSTEAGGPDDSEGAVEFIAVFSRDGVMQKHHERSTFIKKDGSWFLAGGDAVTPRPVVRSAPKIGRNDPCSCGSGKKYKKCCGA